jgi:predicted Zn-dependent protease
MAAGCMTTGQMEPINILTTEEEVQIGSQVAAEVEKNETVLSNAAIQDYVRGIGERLARVSSRQDVTYTFKVIDAPDTVNAFALPGGYMYIYTGLLQICDNEAELAGVMAHEIGHVAAHHHGEMLTRQYGMQLIASWLLGEDPSALAQVAASLIGTGIESRYSRQQEYEADTLGMEFLFRAGYKPDAMLTFMDKMMAEDEKSGRTRPLPIFSSHPPTAERKRTLQHLVNQYPPDMRSGSPVYADRYKAKVKSVLGEASS